MSSTEEETDDLTTCGVCFLQYDADHHIPKFLQCFHFICLQCLKEILSNGVIVCPICRFVSSCSQGPNYLRTNNCALRLIETCTKLKSEKERSNIWCLNCESSAKFSCLKVHCTVDATSTIAASCKKLRTLEDNCKLQLELSIQKLEGLQAKLHEILSCWKVLKSVIEHDLEATDKRILQMRSMIDRTVENEPQLTFERREEILNLFVKYSDLEAGVMNKLSTDVALQKQIRIWIQLEIPEKKKTNLFPLFDDDYGTATNPENLEFCERTILTHMIFMALQEQGIEFNLDDDPVTCPSDDSGNATSSSSGIADASDN